MPSEGVLDANDNNESEENSLEDTSEGMLLQKEIKIVCLLAYLFFQRRTQIGMRIRMKIMTPTIRSTALKLNLLTRIQRRMVNFSTKREKQTTRL